MLRGNSGGEGGAMEKRFAALAALVVCAATVRAQELGAARSDRAVRMNEIMSAYTKDNDFMGSVLVSDGDTVLLNRGYGLASVEWNISDAPDVRFRIASLTKQFAAALVLQLQQEGKLQIGDPVSKYLPKVPTAWGKITLANLLGHTSGISDFTNDPGYGTWDMSEHTHEEELAKIEKPPLDFEPGTKFAYSNSNYEVLGMVLEQVSGQPYEKLLREHVLDPLGMANTGVDTDELVLRKRAEGYRRTNQSLVVARSESMSVPWSAASMYSTTGDLLKWERGLFGGRVLSAESLATMTTPGQGNYGSGLFVEQKYGERVVWHGGEIEGFNAYLGYIPDRRIEVILLSNMNGGAIYNVSDKLMRWESP
jgi:CubicO group peptidase (beta-lactamase class C family)